MAVLTLETSRGDIVLLLETQDLTVQCGQTVNKVYNDGEAGQDQIVTALKCVRVRRSGVCCLLCVMWAHCLHAVEISQRACVYVCVSLITVHAFYGHTYCNNVCPTVREDILWP